MDTNSKLGIMVIMGGNKNDAKEIMKTLKSGQNGSFSYSDIVKVNFDVPDYMCYFWVIESEIENLKKQVNLMVGVEMYIKY